MDEKHVQKSDLRICVKIFSGILLTNMGEKYVQEFGPGSGSIKLFLLGGCRPPGPLLLLGGFQPPSPPGWGPAALRAPSQIFERLRLSSSPFFVGTKIFGPVRTLATKISEFWTCPNPCDKDFRILDLPDSLRQ